VPSLRGSCRRFICAFVPCLLASICRATRRAQFGSSAPTATLYRYMDMETGSTFANRSQYYRLQTTVAPSATGTSSYLVVQLYDLVRARGPTTHSTHFQGHSKVKTGSAYLYNMFMTTCTCTLRGERLLHCTGRSYSIYGRTSVRHAWPVPAVRTRTVRRRRAYCTKFTRCCTTCQSAHGV
jgi:hypothetical protein